MFWRKYWSYMSRKMSFNDLSIAISSSLSWIWRRLSIEIFAMYWPFNVIDDMWFELYLCDLIDSSMFSNRGRICWWSNDSRATLGLACLPFLDWRRRASLTSMFRKDWKSRDLISGLLSSFESKRLTSFSVTVFHDCFCPSRFILSSWIWASFSNLVKLACLINTWPLSSENSQ